MEEGKLNKFLQSLLVTKARVRVNRKYSNDILNSLDPELKTSMIHHNICDDLVKTLYEHNHVIITEEKEDNGSLYNVDVMVFNPKDLRDTLEAFVELHPKYQEMKDKAWKYDQLNK